MECVSRGQFRLGCHSVGRSHSTNSETVLPTMFGWLKSCLKCPCIAAKTISNVVTIEMETSVAYTEEASEISVPEESEANYLDFGYRKDSSHHPHSRSR